MRFIRLLRKARKDPFSEPGWCICINLEWLMPLTFAKNLKRQGRDLGRICGSCMHHVCLLAGFAWVGLLLNKDEFDDLVQNHAKFDSPLLDIVPHPAASSSPSLAPSHPTKDTPIWVSLSLFPFLARAR